MAKQYQLSRWADIVRIIGPIIGPLIGALVTLVGGWIIYNAWNVPDLRYTVLPTYNMQAEAFSGLAVCRRGLAPTSAIQ
jgi:hypothetical protein